MTADIHFVQGGDNPILAGAGSGTLSCQCGHVLITGYDPLWILGVGLQCSRCGTQVVTPQLPDGAMPPSAAIVAEPSSEPRMDSMTVPARVAMVGRAEMERLGALYRPVTPASNIYPMSPERLDEFVALYEDLAGAALPTIAPRADERFPGLRRHPLAWAAGHLRRVMLDPAWTTTQDDATAVAGLHVAGFLHFVATWSHHPLFPAMVATVADHGCSVHALAPFAAAHCLNIMGNRIAFPEPLGYPGRIEGFSLLTGLGDSIPVHVDVFDRFAFPFGLPWDTTNLRAAVSEAIEAVQSRINLRHPGLLVLSPGSAPGRAPGDYDAAFSQVLQSAILSLGRKNRGLMAVATVVLRQQPTLDPQAIRFGYGFFPIPNRRFQGEHELRMGG